MLTLQRLKWLSNPVAEDITSVYHRHNLSNGISYLSHRCKLKLIQDALVIWLRVKGWVLTLGNHLCRFLGFKDKCEKLWSWGVSQAVKSQEFNTISLESNLYCNCIMLWSMSQDVVDFRGLHYTMDREDNIQCGNRLYKMKSVSYYWVLVMFCIFMIMKQHFKKWI